MSRLDDVEIFNRVIDAGGFSAAARALGVSKSHVSKRIRALEERLGAQLLRRDTRRLDPTDVGEAFHARTTQVMADLLAAEEAVAAQQLHPTGTLRVTVPVAFGLRYLTDAVAEFMRDHPQLRVELSFDDRRVRLLDEGFDLAIRVGALADSALTGRRLATIAGAVYGAPAFFARHGVPQRPEELRGLPCLLYDYQASGPVWSFRGPDGEEVRVTVDGPLAANHGDALLAAARQGLGLTLAPLFLACADLHSGALQSCLDAWCPPLAVWAVYPPVRHVPPRVRRFIDFLVERLEEPPWETAPAHPAPARGA